MTLSSKQIENAKTMVKLRDPLHEHDDCIRMAYEWLDAQTLIKSPPKRYHLALKHVIQEWCGRYVSQDDVEIAAYLHPRISGDYPNFNLSKRLTQPNDRRLNGLGEAFAHKQPDERTMRIYSKKED